MFKIAKYRWPPILRLYFEVIGGLPVTGTPVGSRTVKSHTDKDNGESTAQFGITLTT